MSSTPVARLATVRPSGAPHLVPITFAAQPAPVTDESAGVIYTAVDHKPKRTTALTRLANIAAEPRVSVLADHYSPDWSQLWWVRADGHAEVDDSGPAWQAARAALAQRYPQYRETPPEGPAIVIRVHTWRGWAATIDD